MKVVPLSYICISKSALLFNIRLYQKKTKLPVAPVLKSNAYGHGIALVAQMLDRKDIPFFVVNAYDEALHIRASGVEKEILIIGYTAPETIVSSRVQGVSFTITSIDQLQKVARLARHDIGVHIKIDTGMHRQGIAHASIPIAVRIIKRNAHIRVVGLCSHFADADGATDFFVRAQVAIWEKVVAQFRAQIPTIRWVHIAATAGTYFATQCTANLVRLGIGLYGFDCSKSHLSTRPVLSLYSTLTNIQHVSRGARIGYNGTYSALRDMTIATIPVGYYEGIDRRLSNKGWVEVRGVLCPIIGRVSMNITTIDISKVKNPKEGDSVLVVAPARSVKHGVEHIAALCSTITYDICVRFNAAIPRLPKK